jgi:transposase-like protein
MNNISYRRHRFPPEIIQHAVWLYFRSCHGNWNRSESEVG